MVNFSKINAINFSKRSLESQVKFRKFRELTLRNTWEMGIVTVCDNKTMEPDKLKTYTVELLVNSSTLEVEDKLRISYGDSNRWYLSDILGSVGNYLSINSGQFIDTLDFQMSKLNLLLNTPTTLDNNSLTIREQLNIFIAEWECGKLNKITTPAQTEVDISALVLGIESREDFTRVWNKLFPQNSYEVSEVVKSYLFTHMVVTSMLDRYYVNDLTQISFT